MFCMVDLKSKIQEENVISRELLWTPASICHGRKFYLELKDDSLFESWLELGDAEK